MGSFGKWGRRLIVFCTFFFGFTNGLLSQTRASTLTIYAMPPAPVSIDWETPRALLTSTIHGTLLNNAHKIGHVAVEVHCDPEDVASTAQSFITGMTSLSPRYSRKFLLEDSLGFGILTIAWPGRMESQSDVETALQSRSRWSARLAAVTFDISAPACRRLVQFHEAYRTSRYELAYGFAARPRYLEGGGCSAFAASFVEIAGLLTPEIRADWSQTVFIPKGLIGKAGPAGPKVGILDALTHNLSDRWATPSEPHTELTFYDPDRIYEWIRREAVDHPDAGLLEAFDKKFGLIPTEFQIKHGATPPLRSHRFPTVRLNRQSVPTPNEPIFLGEPQVEILH